MIEGIGSYIEQIKDINPNMKPEEFKAQIREVAKDFESAMSSAMIKESLKNAMTSWDEEDKSANEGYKDLVIDQMANYFGQNGMLGIADQLTQQLIEMYGGKKPTKME